MEKIKQVESNNINKVIERPISINSIEEMTNILNRYKIPIDDWGKGRAKNITNLFKEVQEGESEILERGNILIRRLQVLSLNVLYNSPDNVNYVLRESHQFFHDGRKKERPELASVSEKLKANEDITLAIPRALEEELSGIEGPFKFISTDEEFKTKESGAYPGLTSEYKIYKFDVILSDAQYNQQGYFETQKEKTTCFHWDKI